MEELGAHWHATLAWGGGGGLLERGREVVAEGPGDTDDLDACAVIDCWGLKRRYDVPRGCCFTLIAKVGTLPFNHAISIVDGQLVHANGSAYRAVGMGAPHLHSRCARTVEALPRSPRNINVRPRRRTGGSA